LNNLSTRYRENLELVLKDVTINIQPGEKVDENDDFEILIIVFRLELLAVLVVAKVVYVLLYFV
jgi:hypothetical protein